MSKQIKLKSLLKEGFAWERKPGKPLPTIKEVMDEYQSKKEEASVEPIENVKLNENYRDSKENLDILINLLNKNKVKDVISLIQSIQSKLEYNDLESAFDEAVEDFFDSGSRGLEYDPSGRNLS
jgi:hypothetical protein